MGYAQLVIGPAGSGKSTYCSSLQQHCETIGRMVHVVNLDPAAERFNYPVAMDVRDLISLDDVMEELQLGPNGGLMYCMEHLEDCFDDWVAEELENYLEDDYLVFDCPVFGHLQRKPLHGPVRRCEKLEAEPAKREQGRLNKCWKEAIKPNRTFYTCPCSQESCGVS